MNAAKFLAQFGAIANAPEGIQRLREMILQLAVQGKLVPQDANDEPASVLLEKIRTEKESLIKEGKIKRQKPLPAITEAEKPFELPEGWEWVRLNDIGVTNIGLTYSPKNVSETGIPVLRSSNIQKRKIDLSDLVRVNSLVKDDLMVEVGDLLICARNGSKALVGKTAMIKSLNEPMTFGAFMAIYKSSCNSYVEVFLNSLSFRRALEGISTTTINQITQNNLKMTVISLPPEKEIPRIIAKVDSLLSLCDQLETLQTKRAQLQTTTNQALLEQLSNAQSPLDLQHAWQRLQTHLPQLFTQPEHIKGLRDAILQLAVQGKLVPQDANDEPAAVLLEKIKAEKERLIKEGKIKRQKPLPAITEAEKPFTLPEGWEWVRLGEIVELINGDRGKNYPNKAEYVTQGIPWINTGHINPDGTLDPASMNYITDEKFQTLNSGKIKFGDLVYCLRGATFGKTAIIDYQEGAIASSLMIIRPFIFLSSRHIYNYLTSPLGKKEIFKFDNGSAQPNLAASSVRLYLFPLPPNTLQNSINNKVQALMLLCDQLESHLKSARQTQEQFARETINQLS